MLSGNQTVCLGMGQFAGAIALKISAKIQALNTSTSHGDAFYPS
ncbi:MAG: hypothetical protein WA885_12925 [Phormidesmis sp.]